MAEHTTEKTECKQSKELEALLEERIKAQTAQRALGDILSDCLSDLELRIKLDSATRGVNLVYRGSNEYLADAEQCLAGYIKLIEDKIAYLDK